MDIMLRCGNWRYLMIGFCLLLMLEASPVKGQEIQAEVKKGGERQYQEAISLYRDLLQEDPEASNVSRWKQAAQALVRYVESFPESRRNPQSYFYLGNLYQTLFQRQNDTADLSRAVFYYERLTKDFPGHDLSDDALLSLGDLRRLALRDEVGAKAAYYEIIDMYPSGNVATEAKQRISLGEGTLGLRGTSAKSTGDNLVRSKRDGEHKEKQKREKQEAEKKTGGQVEAAQEETKQKEKPRREKTSQGREIFSAPEKRKRPLIVIDPGHGGDEQGAVGADAVLEKDVVLNIALYVDELLKERLRAETLLTRVRDVSLPLQERTKIANESNADLFVSIHANASPLKTLRGIETYYLDNTNDQSSLKLAERENQSLYEAKAGKVGDFDLSFMVSDMIQSGKVEDSISFAHHVQSSLVQYLGKYYRDVKDLGVKKAPFFVLVGAHMPCILVEVSFIDHPEEGRRLGDPRYQKLIADALYRGIRSFYEKNLHLLDAGAREVNLPTKGTKKKAQKKKMGKLANTGSWNTLYEDGVEFAVDEKQRNAG